MEAKLTQDGEGSERKAIVTAESGVTETPLVVVVTLVAVLSTLPGQGPKPRSFCPVPFMTI